MVIQTLKYSGGELRFSDKKLVFESELLNKVFPVGSLYLNINSKSPSSLFGGTWEKLPEGYALWTASSGAGGTIAAGLPNITGTFRNNGHAAGMGYSGAFTGTKDNRGSNSGSAYDGGTYSFNANSGATTKGIYGNSSTVQPPAYKIYAWKRIS